MKTDGLIHNVTWFEPIIIPHAVEQSQYQQEVDKGLYEFVHPTIPSDADMITIKYKNPEGGILWVENIPIVRDGRGIKNITKFYLISNQSTGVTIQTQGWSQTPLTITQEKPYLWTYEIVEYSTGESETSVPMIIGAKGDKGEPAVTVDSQLSTTSTNPVQNKVITGTIGTLSSLATTAKTNLVSAINEADSTANSALSKANTADTEIGTLSSLATTAKTNLVAAINEADSTANSALSKANTADSEIGTLSSLGTSNKTNLVSAINEVNTKVITSSGQISPKFTYVVDSNRALLDWANSVSGNDYSSVLIRRGTWVSSIGVNLTNSGTEVVVGEAGSTLQFSGVEKGLFYLAIPTISGYYMRDVKIICSGTNSTTDSGRDGLVSYGFYNCTNLFSCCSNGLSSGLKNSYGYGFYACSNLFNCTGVGEGCVSTTATYVNGMGYGFYGCSNLINCTGTGTGTGHGLNGYGGYGYGFSDCINLTNCTGTGIGDTHYSASPNILGYGFYNCNKVSGCKKGNTCTTLVFSNSYASFSSTYYCADTPAGGFNDTTN